MAKAWKEGSAGDPGFPEEFEVKQKAVLQVTDIKTNKNKYYCLEVHDAGSNYRLYTHYGRTDDLENNPAAGTRESRYFDTLVEAQAAYRKVYGQKTSASKGYKEVDLASSRIGSARSHGMASGNVDEATLMRAAGPKVEAKPSELHPLVQSLVTYLYSEATNALTSTVAAKITANGIETPLGILTLGQIEKGETLLGEAYALFQQDPEGNEDQLVDLSGEFYTVIPHRIGRSRSAARAAVLNSLGEFEQKQQTLQLMKDMLQVNSEEGGSVLFESQIDQQYKALGCTIGALEAGSRPFKEIAKQVEKSQVKTKHIKVKSVWTLKRDAEFTDFDGSLGNDQLLYHGSRPANWVGILSRGILMPKIVVSMGGARTDAGWLGNGIYFGNAACTTLYYAHPGRRKTRFMTLARVALGKTKQFRKITYGLTEPPSGFNSCHGVRNTRLRKSEFEDDEFVIYRQNQQRMEYLVEYAG